MRKSYKQSYKKRNCANRVLKKTIHAHLIKMASPYEPPVSVWKIVRKTLSSDQEKMFMREILGETLVDQTMELHAEVWLTKSTDRRKADRQTDRQIDRQTHRQTDRQTERQTDRQTDRLRQTDLQTDT